MADIWRPDLTYLVTIRLRWFRNGKYYRKTYQVPTHERFVNCYQSHDEIRSLEGLHGFMVDFRQYNAHNLGDAVPFIPEHRIQVVHVGPRHLPKDKRQQVFSEKMMRG